MSAAQEKELHSRSSQDTSNIDLEKAESRTDKEEGTVQEEVQLQYTFNT